MKELNDFYGLNWVHHIPRLILVPDRKTIKFWWHGDNQSWMTGWLEGRSIYVLDEATLKSEANKIAEPEQYRALIKHELSHAFFNIVSKGKVAPVWLHEGVAVYSSGQNLFRTRPSVFHKFLDFYDHVGKEVYTESGYIIQLLVDKFGKEKLFDLIKIAGAANSPEEFNALFASIYGYKPTYVFFNGLNQADKLHY